MFPDKIEVLLLCTPQGRHQDGGEEGEPLSLWDSRGDIGEERRCLSQRVLLMA